MNHRYRANTIYMLNFFTKEEEKRIISTIKTAEKNTSGEIRVHLIDDLESLSVLDAAAETFHFLEMDETDQRNGVLFFIAPKEHQFAILGDTGINDLVPSNFWDEVKELVKRHFVKSDFAEGVCQGVNLVGEKLKAYFPYQKDDKNELPDDISYS